MILAPAALLAPPVKVELSDFLRTGGDGNRRCWSFFCGRVLGEPRLKEGCLLRRASRPSRARSCALVDIRPASVGVASCTTARNQDLATGHAPVQCIAGVSPCFLLGVLPDRRRQQPTFPVGVANLNANVIYKLAVKRLRAVDQLIEKRLSLGQHASPQERTPNRAGRRES